MVACLSYGDGAFISSLAAADEWHFEECRNTEIHITSTTNLRARDDGVHVHRTRFLPHYDTTLKGRLPIVTPLRALLEIAPLLTTDQLEFPFEYVLRTGMVSSSLLLRRVGEADLRGLAGIGNLRKLMDDDGARTQSALEVMVKQAVARRQLPPPLRQYIITNENGFVAQVDFAYPGVRLGLEAQSWRWHTGNNRWNRDFD
jgi:hypothetical protein